MSSRESAKSSLAHYLLLAVAGGNRDDMQIEISQIVDDIIDAAVETTLAVLPQVRPAQPDELRIRTTRVLFEFTSLDDWTRNAQRRYRMHFDPPASQLGMLAVDSHGQACVCGKHFREAEENHAYPVKVYEVATL